MDDATDLRRQRVCVVQPETRLVDRADGNDDPPGAAPSAARCPEAAAAGRGFAGGQAMNRLALGQSAASAATEHAAARSQWRRSAEMPGRSKLYPHWRRHAGSATGAAAPVQRPFKIDAAAIAGLKRKSGRRTSSRSPPDRGTDAASDAFDTSARSSATWATAGNWRGWPVTTVSLASSTEGSAL